MRNTIIFILVIIACAFSQDRIIDTVYTDSHKVTYVIDTAKATSQRTELSAASTPQQEALPQQEEVADTFGLSAPPNNSNRVTLLLVAQSLSFSLSYEHLFADFWSFALRFGYDGFNSKSIRANTDAEGTIQTFAMPIALRWHWGRRNIGSYSYVGTTSENHRKSNRQVEGFIQAQIAPVLYNVDLHRDSSSYKPQLDLNEKEYALYYTLGFGFNYCYEHFIFSVEMNIGTFMQKPKFQENTQIYKNRYGTRLLDKTIAESALAIGWMF